MNKIKQAQKVIQEMQIDGWLLYDFAKMNNILHQFLELPEDKTYRRRFFYWIPAEGEPVKIVHSIEPHALDGWPGVTKAYSSWQALHQELKNLLKGKNSIAMEYSPNNEIPYVSKVDAGTIDLIRSFGVHVVSSAPLLSLFTAVLDASQAKSHIRAGEMLDSLVAKTWDWIALQLNQGVLITEYDAQQKILEEFEKHHLFTDSPPNVSVNENSADPHYVPTKTKAKKIQKGDFILIDMWCKEKGARAVFADITRVGVAAKKPTEKQEKVFQIVRKAQKAAIDFITERFQAKKTVAGFEIDDVARKVIVDSGYGDFFLHRTGHNIGVELHGSGAHIDNLEMHDVRPILPGTCFSIEPGIYLAGDFGVRLECDILISLEGQVQVTGGIQEEIVCF